MFNNISEILQLCYRHDITPRPNVRITGIEICLLYDSIPVFINDPVKQLMKMGRTKKPYEANVTIGRHGNDRYFMAATLRYSKSIDITTFKNFILETCNLKQWPHILRKKHFKRNELFIHQFVASNYNGRKDPEKPIQGEDSQYIVTRMTDVQRTPISDNAYYNPEHYNQSLNYYTPPVQNQQYNQPNYVHPIQNQQYNQSLNYYTPSVQNQQYNQPNYVHPIQNQQYNQQNMNYQYSTPVQNQQYNQSIISTVDVHPLYEHQQSRSNILTIEGSTTVEKDVHKLMELTLTDDNVSNNSYEEGDYDEEEDDYECDYEEDDYECDTSEIVGFESLKSNSDSYQSELESHKPINSESMPSIDKTTSPVISLIVPYQLQIATISTSTIITTESKKSNSDSTGNHDMTPRRNFNLDILTVIDIDRSTVFFGEKGIGKTSLAKFCLGYDCLIVEQLDDLKRLGAHRGIIFENIDLRDMNTIDVIRLTSPTNRSYRCSSDGSIVKIPNSTQLIFTTSVTDGKIFDRSIRPVYKACQFLKVNECPYYDIDESDDYEVEAVNLITNK